MPIKMQQEIIGGEAYQYFPLGKYVVAAPGICGGRPTFKYTRLEVSLILSRIAAGESLDELIAAYGQSRLSREAVQEAIQLADEALMQAAHSLQIVAIA
ncbi:MAG: DUF433 domain-containing protein [Caldilineaceae bacterium]